ncbi:cell envelope biogenesis protein TolA [Mesorhizobium sp. BR1-1-16]|uniref:cell envelope biogenesis protein TolA n=1 Tax=Mesorhizobium sp. BR1-1-16 TaxID=2876653 RepID=UPI001CCE7BA9|nr:cell envelope biogenesis protein TolA [Mesorhizobium sp. BR1-1-16]MBZ9936699.1 cell envelope biogenesis protein TolA [Mesorhizobium sp. BR1-1-16]
MRTGLITSIIAHLLIIFWGLFALPDTKPFDTSSVEALPVELVPISDLTSLQKGKKTAEVKDKPSPNKPAEKDSPKPAPTPPPPKPTPPSTPPPPKADPTPPAPKAEPTPPAPKAEATPPPTPAAPEKPAEPAPAPSPEPAVAPKPPEAEKVAEAPPPPPAPKPRVRPTPPTPTPPKPDQTAAAKPATPTQSTTDSKFDPDKISALLDRQKPTGSTQASQEPESFGAEEARNPTAMMSQSELDALRSQVQRCWNLPVGWTDPREVTVTIRFKLNQDGTVNGTPSIEQYPASNYGTVAAEGAVRAVLQCGPYQLPAEKYDQWSEVQMRFSPQG